MKKQEITKAAEAQVTAEELKNYLKAANLVAHLTDTETDQFISIAQAFGLNPFKREIYASKYGDNFSIVVGYETYIKRAERSGRLDGWKVDTTGKVDFQNPRQSSLKATITIFRDDFKHPFVHEVYFAEYVQFNRNGQITKFWNDKPITMIKKVAISQGFRMCFSDELGGIPYTKEEIGEEETNYSVVSSGPLQENRTTPAPAEPIPADSEEEKVEDAVDPFEQVKDVLQIALNEAATREEVSKIWNANANFKTNKEFVEMVKAAGDRINEAAKPEHVEDVDHEEVKEEPKKEESSGPGPLFPSRDFSAKEAIEFIETMKTPEELQEFVQDDDRKTVIDAASKKWEELGGSIIDTKEA